MGFLDGLKKMIQGKPVFEDPTKTDDSMQDRAQFDSSVTSPPPAPQQTTPVQQQEKVTPTFDLRHCETHVDGDKITVTIWVTNTSEVDIEIDKCVILDTKTEIDRRLSPGQAHEIILYKGAAPRTDLAHKANIFYRSIRENDYYRVDFSVEYNHESDGSYTIEDLHPEHYKIKEIM